MATLLKPALTESGLGMIVKALNGDSIKFSRIALGNGQEPADPSTVTALSNEVLSIGITNYVEYTQAVGLTGTYNNADITAGYFVKEIGVFAEDSNETEYLYAYQYIATDTFYVPGIDTDGYSEAVNVSLAVAVGDAESISAVLIPSASYASRAELESHIADHSNPHLVTAEQVGLGNVPNVTTDNQTPTVTTAGTLATPVAGDTLKTIVGKVTKAIGSLISHIGDRTIHITASERTSWNSKANAVHTHSSDQITSGTLSIARGGTGGTTAAAARTNLGVLGMKSGTAVPTTNTCPAGYVYFQYTP